MRPSQQMKKALTGDLSQCDESVKSWLRLHVYREACRILAMPFDRRKNAILDHPLSDMVEEQVTRLFELRKKKK